MKIGNQFAWNGRVSSYLYAMKEHIIIYSDSRINHNKVRGIYFEISGFTWLPPKVLNQQKNMRNLQQVHNKLHLQFESTAIIWMDSHSKNSIFTRMRDLSSPTFHSYRSAKEKEGSFGDAQVHISYCIYGFFTM